MRRPSPPFLNRCNERQKLRSSFVARREYIQWKIKVVQTCLSMDQPCYEVPDRHEMIIGKNVLWLWSVEAESVRKRRRERWWCWEEMQESLAVVAAGRSCAAASLGGTSGGEQLRCAV